MPDIFKALATILAWIFFIGAVVMGISAFIMGIITGNLYGAQPPMVLIVSFAVSLAQIFTLRSELAVATSVAFGPKAMA